MSMSHMICHMSVSFDEIQCEPATQAKSVAFSFGFCFDLTIDDWLSVSPQVMYSGELVGTLAAVVFVPLSGSVLGCALPPNAINRAAQYSTI